MQILVIKLSSLGDILHAVPAVHALGTGLKADVDWVTQAEYEELVRCCPAVRRVYALDRRGGWREWWRLRSELAPTEYDLVLDLQGLLKSAGIVLLARGLRKVGPAFAREGARFLYPETVGTRVRGKHAVDRLLDMLQGLGLKTGPPDFTMRFPIMSRTEPRPRVAMAPVSRWPTKNWPLESYAELACRLHAAAGCTVYLVGSPAERRLCERVAEASQGGSVVNLAGTLSLAQTGGLLAQMDLVVANDSGLAHLAVAAGTPVLGLYGPTDPALTGPYGLQNRVLSAEVSCRPCFSRVCREETLACLRVLKPEYVADAALAMLKMKGAA